MKDGEREATAKVVASVWGTYCNVEFNRFLQIDRGKKYSTAMNWTNSATQTNAKTFAFASLSILLLWEGGSPLYCTHCSQNDLNFRITTEPVLFGAGGATVNIYVWFQRFLRFLKMRTLLWIDYIFFSSIPKNFLFQNVTGTLKIYIFSWKIAETFLLHQRTIVKNKVQN